MGFDEDPAFSPDQIEELMALANDHNYPLNNGSESGDESSYRRHEDDPSRSPPPNDAESNMSSDLSDLPKPALKFKPTGNDL
jgi:hypothetical protein